MQIPISVAQGWLSGGDSPIAMWTDQNHLAASYCASERHWSSELDPGAQGES